MAPAIRIKRFSTLDRITHLFLMLSFIIQAATGFSRLYYTTTWGKKLGQLMGGYEAALQIHQWIGVLMIIGFLIYTVYLVTRLDWRSFPASLFGPDSLVPNLQDVKHLWQRILWFFGIGSPPRFSRWSYWEKFDFWAVYWGMPLLAVTGLMTMFPMATSRFLPGWILNVAVLLHRAEAVLAVAYIFIIHFFIGHFRPLSFPMNEAMFSGSMPLDDAMEEKPAWVQKMNDEGRLDQALTHLPTYWFRVTYFVFGYAVVAFGLYLLVNGMIYSRFISLH